MRARPFAAMAMAVALVATAALLVTAEQGPGALLPATRSFLDGSMTSPYALGVTLRTAAPILLTGLAASLTFRGGLFDVGQPGYLVIGGLTAAVVGSATPGPAPLALCTGLLAGALGGMAWAAGVAWTTSLTGAAIVVVSLISANLAAGVAQLLTARVFQDPGVSGIVETRAVPGGAMLPLLEPESQLRADVLVALVVVVATTWWGARTASGHRLRMFGGNPEFAALAGTPPDSYRRRLTMVGGAICGLAGGLAIFGEYGRFLAGTLGGNSSPAWLGITMAVLTSRFLFLLPAAFLLAAMETGFEGTQRDLGIGGSLGIVIQALLLGLAALSRRTPSAAGE
jgi:general nucleoside transport system permease protein